MNGTKPYVLRNIYCKLTNDCSAARTLEEREVDARVQEVLSTEDPDLINDLRYFNHGPQTKYEVFWEKCTQYISEYTAVYERCHGDTYFMAKAISVRDQVSKLCPPDTAIPSEPWVRLNFCPRNPHAKVSVNYHSRLNVKHVIQKQLFRKDHPDAHYCAGLFCYQREQAVEFQENSTFIFIDDKHRIKVGEPGYPVAAVERGKQVIISRTETFAVGDHDFTKVSLIPNVILQIDIPDKFEGPWYSG